MKLFKKKGSKVSYDTNENLSKIKEEMEEELENLEKEINEKNERLHAILEKMELAKKEYDEIISKIIQSKKELRSNENSDSNTDNLIELSNEEIGKNEKINDQLKEEIANMQPFVSGSEDEKKKIDEELSQRKKELEVMKKRLVEMKQMNKQNKDEDDSKNVVEAASQIIATTNKRLEDTMKELEITKQLLEKERKAHNETKKKLQN